MADKYGPFALELDTILGCVDELSKHHWTKGALATGVGEYCLLGLTGKAGVMARDLEAVEKIYHLDLIPKNYRTAIKYLGEAVTQVVTTARRDRWEDLREEAMTSWDFPDWWSNDDFTDWIIGFNDSAETTFKDIREVIRIARMRDYGERVFSLNGRGHA